jgi:hypothetical protein
MKSDMMLIIITGVSSFADSSAILAVYIQLDYGVGIPGGVFDPGERTEG